MRAGVRLLLRGVGLALMGFPAGIGRPRTDVERLRRYAFRERFRTKPWVLRLLLWWVCMLAWPLGALLEVCRNARGLPRATWRDSLLMYRWALVHNVPPVEYAAYRFHEPSARALWADYLYWFDVPVLKRLNRLRGAVNQDVQNKLRFAGLCAARGLPHVPAFASSVIHEETLPRGDIWLKALDRNGGAASELWRRDPAEGADGYTGRTGRLTAGQLLQHAKERSLLLQPRILNHASLEPLTNGALASLRLVTAHFRDGRVSWLGNMLVLPQGSSITSAGGAVCAVSWETGTVKQVMLAMDPELTVKATGWLVPFWKESLELVCQAHREAFPLFATLGWDVALTPEGPLLLETNSGWGALAMQQMWGPLGKTSFAELVREELATAV